MINFPGDNLPSGVGGDAGGSLGATIIDRGTVQLGVGADAAGTDISSNGAQTVGALGFTTYGTSGTNVLNVNNVGADWTSGSATSYLTLPASLWPDADFTKRNAVIVTLNRGTSGASGEVFAYMCGDAGLAQRTGIGRLNTAVRAQVIVNSGLTVKDGQTVASDEQIEGMGWISDGRSSMAFYWADGETIDGILSGNLSACVTNNTVGALPGTDSIMLGMLGGNSRGERFVSVQLVQLEA